MTQLAIGEATPHGATYDGHGVNFTLFSAHAERVELCVFDSRGNERRYDLPGRRGDVWHGYLAGARPGLRYGYRVHGPWQPAQGHRFNPAKLLLDPYARRVEGELKDHPLLHGGHDEPDYRDNAAVAPKSVIATIMTGKMTPRRARRGEKRSSMKRMSKGLPTCIRNSPRRYAAPIKRSVIRSWWRISNSLALRRWNCCRWRSLPASRACNVWD